MSEALVGTDVTVHESGETALPSPESLKERDEVEADVTENMPAVEEEPEDALQADISIPRKTISSRRNADRDRQLVGSYPSSELDTEIGWVSGVLESSYCPPVVEPSLL